MLLYYTFAFAPLKDRRYEGSHRSFETEIPVATLAVVRRGLNLVRRAIGRTHRLNAIGDGHVPGERPFGGKSIQEPIKFPRVVSAMWLSTDHERHRTGRNRISIYSASGQKGVQPGAEYRPEVSKGSTARSCSPYLADGENEVPSEWTGHRLS